MRVLIVSPFFPPKQSSGSLRAHAFAQQFAAEHHEVTVLTTHKADRHATMPMPIEGIDVRPIDFHAPRFLDRLRSNAPAPTQPAAQPTPSALQRLRARTGIFGGSRLPDLTHWWIKPATTWACTHAQQAGPWDLVLSSSGPYTAHLVARAIKRANAARLWVSDYRDLWTDNPIHAGLPLVRAYERALERSCIREADAITTVSPPLVDSLSAQTKTRVELIYNGFDELAAKPIDQPPPPPTPPTPIRLVHTGTIYEPWQQPKPLTDAIRTLTDAGTEIELHVAGDSDQAWQSAANASGIRDRLISHGHVARAEALTLQATAHALIVLGFTGDAWPSIPAKLFEYLPKPATIFAIGGDRLDDPIAHILKQTCRGNRLPSDPAVIAEAIVSLQNPKPNDNQSIVQYARAHQAKRLTEMCQRLIEHAASVQSEHTPESLTPVPRPSSR